MHEPADKRLGAHRRGECCDLSPNSRCLLRWSPPPERELAGIENSRS